MSDTPLPNMSFRSPRITLLPPRERGWGRFVPDDRARPHHGYLERMKVRTFRACCPALSGLPAGWNRAYASRPALTPSPPRAFSRRAVSARPMRRLHRVRHHRALDDGDGPQRQRLLTSPCFGRISPGREPLRRHRDPPCSRRLPKRPLQLGRGRPALGWDVGRGHGSRPRRWPGWSGGPAPGARSCGSAAPAIAALSEHALGVAVRYSLLCMSWSCSWYCGIEFQSVAHADRYGSVLY